MCGLVGVAGKLTLPDESLMKRLLLLDWWRGQDSTGLASVLGEGHPEIVKRATHPINLFDSKEFQRVLDARKSFAFIGHNRAATVGVVNEVNAHPFQYGNITGAHNGTIDKASWKRLEDAAGIETTVDSAAIFACIDKIGIDETLALIEHGRTSSTGAWALVWFDYTRDTMCFIRNEHRPLWYAVHEKESKFVWASESIMIQAAEEPTASWSLEADDEGYSLHSFEEDWLYEVPLRDVVMEGISVKEFDKYKVREIKGKEPAPVLSTTMGYPPFHKPATGKTEYGTTTGTTTSPTNTQSHSTGGTGTKVVDITSSVSEPLGGVISPEAFKAMSNDHHCSWCKEDITIHDHGLTIFPDNEVVLCKSCTGSKSEGVKIYLKESAIERYLAA